MIKILFFAHLREQLDCAGENLDLPESVKSVADLRQFLCARGAPWSTAMSEDQLLMMSVNQSLSGAETAIQEGDEIGFFPPVTGG